MSEVVVFTGEKGIGKSAHLQKLFGEKKNFCGILQPRISGVKYLFDITSAESRRLELEEIFSDEVVISIGKYHFSRAVFNWGNEKLLQAVASANQNIIIDEIGPLELSGEGLEPILSEVMRNGLSLRKNFLLVVRPVLVEQVILKYRLPNSEVIRYGEKYSSLNFTL